MTSFPPPQPPARRPPVDVMDCPHTGDTWLVPWGRLTADDCEALSEVLADRARARRAALGEPSCATAAAVLPGG
ncbi:hypothetical protein [Streptosporangium longisporum]|uniref:Uncharacterized protein n=1 Tax=Streptosporangium longisporum TaxID=46187 RepID=A0ABP6KZA6_9ACTN